MTEDTENIRQRRPVKEVDEDDDDDNIFAGTPAENSRGKKSKKAKVEKVRAETDEYSPYLDILRVLSFLFLASCSLSYLQSNGESFFWGQKNKPWYMKPSYWKAKWNGPLYFTPEELLQYDGSDPEKPIYLAINHTVFDVSANPRTYGPGGSYNVFAGHDASRAFVTGCFMEDRTPDMRGVEEMFLPLDDPEIDRQWSHDDMLKLREEEMAAAQVKVHEALKHWVDFFSKSDKYGVVGKVKRSPDWLEKEKKKKLCDQAQQGRIKRKPPGQEGQD